MQSPIKTCLSESLWECRLFINFSILECEWTKIVRWFLCLNPEFADVIDMFTVSITYFLALNKNFWEQHFMLHYLYVRKVIDLVSICNPTARVFFIWFCLVGWFGGFWGFFGLFSNLVSNIITCKNISLKQQFHLKTLKSMPSLQNLLKKNTDCLYYVLFGSYHRH